jgi:hypothetical protein
LEPPRSALGGGAIQVDAWVKAPKEIEIRL